MVTVVNGTTNKPAASECLVDFFRNHDKLEGLLYIGYPILGSSDGKYPIDAVWISYEYDLVIFNLVEGHGITEKYGDFQDDSANKMDAKLRMYRQLLNKRKLCVNLNVVTYAPAVGCTDFRSEEYPLCVDDGELERYIEALEVSDGEHFEELVSILQSISKIRKGMKKRTATKAESRAAKLMQLEESIATLDNSQNKAVIETVDGVQRIRGLAGSGKTVVLALKAAYLHMQHPEWKIAVTFNTRSLKGQFRRLITSFYMEQTGDEPDWENLQIIHAWGASGGGERLGIYYKFCSLNNLDYYDFRAAKGKFGEEDPFGGACREALGNIVEYARCYDAILVDEAQDFSPSFLCVCYEMLKAPKRLVYAYDELQNLRLQSLPSPEEIFGKNNHGEPRVKFMPNEDGRPQQDIILKKCYRNSRQALVTAHALGFGIYRDAVDENSGLVQMFEHSSLWKDIGYEVAEGSLEDGKHVVLRRTAESSPKFLEEHSAVDDLVLFKSFKTQEEQNQWVADEIERNLKEDELRPDDIIVINPNPYNTKAMVAPIRAALYKMNIQSHTAGIDTAPDIFFSDDKSIAFSGIYRAKGNEAAMVYVINAQECFDAPFDLAKIRNRLFTAITRSKAWVRVLGVGDGMKSLTREYEKVKENNFTLDFTYPTKAQREHMNVVNRDMSASEKNKVQINKNHLKNLIEDLTDGKIYREDLGTEEINKLMELLKGGE